MEVLDLETLFVREYLHSGATPIDYEETLSGVSSLINEMNIYWDQQLKKNDLTITFGQFY